MKTTETYERVALDTVGAKRISTVRRVETGEFETWAGVGADPVYSASEEDAIKVHSLAVLVAANASAL